MTLRWPCDVLHPQNVAFDIAPRTLAAPASVSGITQVVATDAGIWKATYGDIGVRNRNSVLAFRAIGALLEGRLGSVLVPLCRAYQPRIDLAPGEAPLYAQVPHSDETFFDDDSGYVGSVNSVTLAGALSARAISANITIAHGGTIEPGQHFSIGERLYRIRTVTYTAANAATITFRPPLREAAAAGVVVNFDDPVCRMRLATDNAMDLELALHRFGQPTVVFLEDL
jgi:hypothetical protein